MSSIIPGSDIRIPSETNLDDDLAHRQISYVPRTWVHLLPKPPNHRGVGMRCTIRA